MLIQQALLANPVEVVLQGQQRHLGFCLVDAPKVLTNELFLEGQLAVGRQLKLRGVYPCHRGV